MDNKMLERYDDSIEMILGEIDPLDEGISEEFLKEWKEVRKEEFNAKEKTALKKKYLTKILGYEKDETEYEFYKIILEFLGIDEYVLDSEISAIKNIQKK